MQRVELITIFYGSLLTLVQARHVYASFIHSLLSSPYPIPIHGQTLKCIFICKLLCALNFYLATLKVICCFLQWFLLIWALCLLTCIISLDVPISIHPLRSDISLGMLSCLLVFLHYYIHKDLDNFSVLILGCYGVTLVFPFLLFQLFFFKDNNTWL